MKTLEQMRALEHVMFVDDERELGNSIIVTLAEGWFFADDPDCGVQGFDTITDARRGCARKRVVFDPERYAALNPEPVPAPAEQQEAQGAQAGDLASAVRVLLEVPQLQGEQAFSAQPIIDRVRAALATQPVVPVSAEAMSFEYAHISGERRTVSITREDVIEGMEDALYEKLSDQICRCEPIGETNVVECNCQDYVEEFTLVSAKPAVRGAEHE